MEIKLWPIERVSLYAKNPRKRSDVLVRKVAASIQEFGWQQPLVVDTEGVLIVGHTRLEAARHLELEAVPVHVADLPPAKAKAYRLMDNRSHEESVWDTELLSLELAELKELDFDLDLTGFDADELGQYIYPDETEFIPSSNTKEINPDEYQMEHRCPRCGFEFNDDEQSA